MGNTKQVAKATSTTSTTSTTTASKDEVLVRLTPKVQKAVKALAQAHAVEKTIDAQIAEARAVILSAIDLPTTAIGTDARGKRLVKVQVIEPKATKYDTSALVKHLEKTNPELLAMFALPMGDPTKRVLTL